LGVGEANKRGIAHHIKSIAYDGSNHPFLPSSDAAYLLMCYFRHDRDEEGQRRTNHFKKLAILIH